MSNQKSAANVTSRPQQKDQLTQHSKPPIDYVYQEEYKKLEMLSHELARDQRLSLHQETVYNVLAALSPFRLQAEEWSDEVIKARMGAIQLISYFLDQLIISAPLLLMEGYEISSQDNCLKLIRSLSNGVYFLHTDCMAPLLPQRTWVYFSQINRDEWKQTECIVLVHQLSQFDTDFIGRIIQVTDDSLTLRRENPNWPDVTIAWSDVLRMYGFYFLMGDRIQ